MTRRGLSESQNDHGDIRQPVSGKHGYSLKGFAEFCPRLVLEDGSHMRLERFERAILKEHFEGAQEVVILLPKKNYKTTLMAALALYHLEAVPEAEVVMGAASRDQARIMHTQAEGLAKRSKLDHVLRYREIRHNGGRMRALAADADTGDGVIPTLALVDELHRHKTGELYGLFRDGLDARAGRMVTISTAGYNSDSPLGKLRALAHGLSSFTRKGVYNYAVSEDGGFAFHEWCLTDEDNLGNMRQVKRVNPARHHTIQSLRRRYLSPSMTPSRWARFACGIWTEGEEPWIEPKAWDRLKVDIGRLQEGETIWVAVAIGMNPGIALAARRPDGGVAVRAEIREGETQLGPLESRLLEIANTYVIEQIVWGQQQFIRSAELLEEQGLPLMEFPLKPRLPLVSMTLKRLIEENKLRHDGNEELRAQVMAGVAKETQQGWHLLPSQRTRALIAMAVACHIATQTEPASVYETRDLGVFG